MKKPNQELQATCNLLNEMLALDYIFTDGLLTLHLPCNKELAEHSTIQVRKWPDIERYTAGILGVLNGLSSDPNIVITAEYLENGKLSRFYIQDYENNKIIKE